LPRTNWGTPSTSSTARSTGGERPPLPRAAGGRLARGLRPRTTGGLRLPACSFGRPGRWAEEPAPSHSASFGRASGAAENDPLICERRDVDLKALGESREQRHDVVRLYLRWCVWARPRLWASERHGRRVRRLNEPNNPRSRFGVGGGFVVSELWLLCRYRHLIDRRDQSRGISRGLDLPLG
jgi:hypothetical protein